VQLRVPTTGALALVTTVISACTGGHRDTQASGVPQSGAPQSGAPQSGAANVVTIVARDYAYDAPDTIPAGLTTFQLRNTGKEPHETAIVRLDDGKTSQDLLVLARDTTPSPDPAWMHWVGGPGGAFPGGLETNATMVLAPGHYVVACFVPTSKGQPHLLLGMIKDFTVAPSSRPAAAPPASDVSISLVDFDYKFATPLTAGHHTIRITNDGAQSHQMGLLRLAPGQSVKTVLAWFEHPNGPPPIEWTAGISDLSPGAVTYITGDFPPGSYALFCFDSDVHDGKSHIAHGMTKQFSI
jgi:hypothetical protein